MEDSITAARVANAILQDHSFSGHYVLVEGKKDVKLYRRFINEETARIRITSGKKQLKEAFDILSRNNYQNKIAIRDADFLRINNNPKFDPGYCEPIFATDSHDSEVMIVQNGTLDDYFLLISDSDKVLEFEKIQGKPILDLIFSLLYQLGCLRLANKRFQMGLAFKPKKIGGNKLKIEKFISEKTWQFLGDKQMVHIVCEYSKNRDREEEIPNEDFILQRLNEIVGEAHPANEIINGHDVAEVLLMISKAGLKSNSKLLQDSSCVEDLLTACFDLLKFSKTGLHASIEKWQISNNVKVFREI